MSESLASMINCSICGSPRRRIAATRRKGLAVYLCENIKIGQRMPCDGYPPVLKAPSGP